ncbi:hypothetical protein UNDYM_4051 [Undibacterium sp. YM2]|jgi:hypothetical protein|uniref:hypothetical protein n=1 Tax=Undibacterium sp. YM2 TaxID=2058625 RepID=UPI001331C91F|nr:hypothetical protein [Undibacterium sp. YM2]BBB68304.1 hypothetical protein UNDYM_4051 [Undibacterium sp. YM2]
MFLKTMQGCNRSDKLMQRPSIVTAGSISTASNLDEGVVRIGNLCEDDVDDVQIDEETISEITAALILKLRQNGMPFLDRLQI